jgi:hypothetical protein
LRLAHRAAFFASIWMLVPVVGALALAGLKIGKLGEAGLTTFAARTCSPAA